MTKRRDTLYIALWIVLGWASIPPIPLWAENQDSRPTSASLSESDYKGNVQEEFYARLAEMRSISKRKDALMAKYGELARLRRDFKIHQDKLEGQVASAESKGPSATLSDRQHLLHLRAIAKKLQNHINYNRVHMDSLIAEYDVLSRMDELESSHKAKGIIKADFTSEERGLREELAHINAERRMNYLGEDIMEGFAQIENQMMNITQSLRSASVR